MSEMNAQDARKISKAARDLIDEQRARAERATAVELENKQNAFVKLTIPQVALFVTEQAEDGYDEAEYRFNITDLDDVIQRRLTDHFKGLGFEVSWHNEEVDTGDSAAPCRIARRILDLGWGNDAKA